jgi:rubrerythrin
MQARATGGGGAPTTADVLAFAHAMEAAAADRFATLTRWAEGHGAADLAALFASLAAMEVEHEASVAARGPVQGADPARVRRLLPPELLAADADAAELRSALLTPYRALSLAVRAEERAFASYAHLAAMAPTDAVRTLAEDLARDELDHAAVLRRARRQAFHAERPAEPAVPATLSALHASRATWEAEAGPDAPDDPARVARLSRLLERYLLVAERAGDEAVLAEAQRLADATLQRLLRAGA